MYSKMNTLRRSVIENSLLKRLQPEASSKPQLDRGYVNILPSVGSSVSSEDDFINRAVYSRVRQRMKPSDSETSSTDDDLKFEEVHYGDILSRKYRRRKLRGKFLSRRYHLSSDSSYSDMSNSSTPEKQSKRSSPVYFDPYPNSDTCTNNEPTTAHNKLNKQVTNQENVITNKAKVINLGNNIRQSPRMRGQVKLVMCGSSDKVTLTLLEMQFSSSNSPCSHAYLKVHLTPDGESTSHMRFRTNTVKIGHVDSPLVFHETFTLNLPPLCESKRILITAWARNVDGQRPYFIGCMSFGLRKFKENNEIIQGTYYLLSENLGRRKHLSAKSQKHNIESPFPRQKNESRTSFRERKRYTNIFIDLSRQQHCGFQLNSHIPEITSVNLESQAYKSGLRVGDLIHRINQQFVDDIGYCALRNIIRNCTGTLQLSVYKSKRVGFQDDEQAQPVRRARKRRSQYHSEETHQRIKRNRVSRVYSFPGTECADFEDPIKEKHRKSNYLMERFMMNEYSSNEEEDDVFVSNSEEDDWKKLNVSTVKTSCPVYYDLNPLVNPVEVLPVQTKSAKILSKKSINYPVQSIDNTYVQLPNNKLNYCEPLQAIENRRHHAEICKLTRNVQVKEKNIISKDIYVVPESSNSLEALSLSSDSGISEENDATLSHAESKDSSLKRDSDSRKSISTKRIFRQENKRKLLGLVSRDNLRKNCDKKKSKLTLLQVLESRKATQVFRAFLQKEHSEENLDFWIECELFKSLKSKKIQKAAEKIYSRFLDCGAPQEVNITCEIRSAVQKKLTNATKSMFKEAQNHIFYLMESDSFGRYLESG